MHAEDVEGCSIPMLLRPKMWSKEEEYVLCTPSCLLVGDEQDGRRSSVATIGGV
jgi:hypothetical protein